MRLVLNRSALVVLVLITAAAVAVGWWLSPSRGHESSLTHCIEIQEEDPRADALIEAALDGSGRCVVTYP